MPENFPIILVYDKEVKRAGCAILQAAYGGTISNMDLMGFNNWLLVPTDNLKPYKVNNMEELEKIKKLTNNIHKKF